MRASALLLLALLSSGLSFLQAQKLDPVQWTLTLDPATAKPGAVVTGKLTAQVGENYHIYSLSQADGAIPTSMKLADHPAVASVKVYQPPSHRQYDVNLNAPTETFEKETVFLLAIQLKPDAAPGAQELTANVRYAACNDKVCLPPRKKAIPATLTIDPSAAASALNLPNGYTEFIKADATNPPTATAAPPIRQGDLQGQGLAGILLIAFAAGLAAIFTPCVFPMIPITVSFFLSQNQGGNGRGLRQAIIFCLGIIGLFTLLGFLVTAVAGPFGVVQLAASPWVNALIATVFFVFGLSLLGAFEITLPSSVLTRMNNASQGSGTIPTLLMGLTFSLTSFACVGPIVGTLLAASVQSKGWQPVAGMFAFATGLALPFFLLALFPGFLQRLPRSGGWLARVKIVLGFVVLAAMLKYLSNVDAVLQWNLLTRERFLAAWFVLFLLPGLYLLGLLKMEGIKSDEPVGLGRLLSGAAFIIFAVALLPGMFGTRLGELDAVVPVASASSGIPGCATVAEAGPVWLKDQYDAALAQAKRENKMILLTFTGEACTNCHWMKANMFPKPAIRAAVKDLILVELYTDRSDAISQQNQQLQEKLVNSVAIPYYVLLSGDGKMIAGFSGSTRSEPDFLAFLRTGGETRAAL